MPKFRALKGCVDFVKFQLHFFPRSIVFFGDGASATL